MKQSSCVLPEEQCLQLRLYMIVSWRCNGVSGAYRCTEQQHDIGQGEAFAFFSTLDAG